MTHTVIVTERLVRPVRSEQHQEILHGGQAQQVATELRQLGIGRRLKSTPVQRRDETDVRVTTLVLESI